MSHEHEVIDAWGPRPTDPESLEERFRGAIFGMEGMLRNARAQGDGLQKTMRCLRVKGFLRGLYCGYAMLHGHIQKEPGKPKRTLWRKGNALFHKLHHKKEGEEDEV